MQVPFVDLARCHEKIRDEVRAAMDPVITESGFVGGPFLAKFEASFASYCGARLGVGTSSGTSALRLALAACGVGPGDEVITTPSTFIATAEAISEVCARPVFVDVDQATGNMDASLLRERITDRTKAIIPVHLYGCPCDMAGVMEAVGPRAISIIEDACQAHGAEYLFAGEWTRTGSKGRVGCFSFYPTKNLGAFGEGGIIVTSDGAVAEKVAIHRDHGQKLKNVHEVVGSNERLDSLQAAILNVKLAHLDEWNAERRTLAAKYGTILAETPVSTCTPGPGFRHVYHLYVIRTRNRDALQEFLKSKGIGTAVHYPTPIHLQPAYRHLGYRQGDFPVAERRAREILSLPMFVGLRDEEVEYVAGAVVEFFRQSR
jgi:dTDP-4-amino-4,6-dideoxygalactose transaminase